MEARVGRAFLDSTHMLLAFETYCVNQCSAALLVDQLTQEREVLRVFLDQLQKERPSLRKMDLKAFLMLPVQRVTKWVYELAMGRYIIANIWYIADIDFIGIVYVSVFQYIDIVSVMSETSTISLYFVVYFPIF